MLSKTSVGNTVPYTGLYIHGMSTYMEYLVNGKEKERESLVTKTLDLGKWLLASVLFPCGTYPFIF